MQRPPLATDIDETVAYYLRHFLDFYNDKFETDFREEHFKSYRWWEVLGITKAQAYHEAELYAQERADLIEEDPTHVHIEFCEGAMDALGQLARFYTLHGITKRSETLCWDTHNISSCLIVPEDCEDDQDELILPVDRIYDVPPHGSKADVCRQYNIATIIEDNADDALQCAQQGIRAIVLARPWNRDMPAHRLITPVKDWQGVCDALLDEKVETDCSRPDYV